MLTDPHHPIYHFSPPLNWMNDPNGLIHWNGVYHMFYQYNPEGAFHHKIHWGHATSTDLVHWTHLPIPLSPTPGLPDEDGCWSGCAVNDDGVATILYTGFRHGEERPCLARGGGNLDVLEKYPHNPIIAEPPSGLDLIGFRDHCVWKEGELWYQLIGSGIKGVGGTALLYSSRDLVHWSYMHPFYLADLGRMPQLAAVSMWECPDFFSLTSTGSKSEQPVLVVSVIDGEHGTYSGYFTGIYSKTDHRFTAEKFLRLDYGESFYAPQTLSDASGRRIMWGWLREERDEMRQREAGWSGVMSLPRILSLGSDGTTMEMRPAPELEALRGNHFTLQDIVLQDESVFVPRSPGGVAELRGDTLEITARFEPGEAKEVGIGVRCSPEGGEQTRIIYDCIAQELVIDTSHSSLDNAGGSRRYSGPLCLLDGEMVTLRIFLDRSVVEVFANGRLCITSRIYPTRNDSLSLLLFAGGGKAQMLLMDIWEMDSIWNSQGGR